MDVNTLPILEREVVLWWAVPSNLDVFMRSSNSCNNGVKIPLPSISVTVQCLMPSTSRIMILRFFNSPSGFFFLQNAFSLQFVFLSNVIAFVWFLTFWRWNIISLTWKIIALPKPPTHKPIMYRKFYCGFGTLRGRF